MDENPILRTPYEEPTTYFELDSMGRNTKTRRQGRRPSEGRTGIPGGGDVILDPENVEPHKTINKLRCTIMKWRKAGYPGITGKTRRLLEFWQGIEVGARPFWCQMEAIETAIWLFEIEQTQYHKKILHKLAVLNHRYNDDIPRIALKMATGTGKTHVMAMLMLWMLVNGHATDFLIIAPNLTVKERLQILDPKTGRGLWERLTPRAFRRQVNKADVTIANFQAFQERRVVFGDKSLGKGERRLLGEHVKNFEESDTDMIRRILRGHRKDAKFIVINDEAHHCYKPTGNAQQDDDQKAAALWFNAIKILKEQDMLAQVYDFSATPMWLTIPLELDSEIFPWTVSDFPLLDAIESGLVKIPCVPVQDDTESYQPKYRNIYEYNDGKDLAKNLSVRVREPLQHLYRDYHDRVNPLYEGRGITPVFIVVVNKIKNAVLLYKWFAGSQARGNLDMFSNYNTDGSSKEHPPTLLVHSRLFDKVSPTGHEKEMVKEQSELFKLKGSLAEKQEQIRSLFTNIGSGDARNIRCVISVGMLTEGWDAKNVTHIFGYRRFGSLLLCEQVTGRALRRTSFVGSDRQKPEYANVFGVPYTFAPGGETDPQPPVQPYEIRTMPGREWFRISFPNVVGYENPTEQRRFWLNDSKVEPYIVESEEPTKTISSGSGGKQIVTARNRREQEAIWEMANKISTILMRDSGEYVDKHVAAGRGLSFVDSVRIVKKWLNHPNVQCKDVAGIPTDSHIPQQIAQSCEFGDEAVDRRPVFADVVMEGERLLTTEDVMFETTLPYTYPEESFLKKSELNRAACHSKEESQIARILDTHPQIEAWTRNFRLDFLIPYFKESDGAWHNVEPDFIARVKTKDGSLLHLVIEFKGMKQGEVDEAAKQCYIEKWWCPAVTNSGEYGEWRSVWIDDIDVAREMISGACA